MLASRTKLSCLVDSLRSFCTSSVVKAKGGHRGGRVRVVDILANRTKMPSPDYVLRSLRTSPTVLLSSRRREEEEGRGKGRRGSGYTTILIRM